MDTKIEYLADGDKLYRVVRILNNGSKICSQQDRDGLLLSPAYDIKVSKGNKVFGKSHWVTWIKDVQAYWTEWDRRQAAAEIEQEKKAEKARNANEKYALDLAACKAANPDLMQSFQKDIMPGLSQIKFNNFYGQPCLFFFSVEPAKIYKWGAEVKIIEGFRLSNSNCWCPEWTGKPNYGWNNSYNSVEDESLEELLYNVICNRYWK